MSSKKFTSKKTSLSKQSTQDRREDYIRKGCKGCKARQKLKKFILNTFDLEDRPRILNEIEKIFTKQILKDIHDGLIRGIIITDTELNNLETLSRSEMSIDDMYRFISAPAREAYLDDVIQSEISNYADTEAEDEDDLTFLYWDFHLKKAYKVFLKKQLTIETYYNLHK